MRLFSTFAAAAAVISSQTVSAMRIIESNSLSTCMANSSFAATLFQVAFTPDNGSLAFQLNGVSQISGKVLLDMSVIAYGLNAYSKVINPCDDESLNGLCPMNQGEIPNLPSNVQLPASTVNQIPSVIYYIPDIDGKVRVWINNTEGQALACVEAELSNTKTVNQKSVAWVVAIIAGLGLAISAIVSGLGHSNTAAHIASAALSLFTYFQAQAFIGMTAVTSPPIVRAWTQNFQWSMGIIRVGFLQKMATWYQRSTGGTPSTVISGLANTSVLVAKRSLQYLAAASGLMKRTNSATTNAELSTTLIVHGIPRVGFVAGIETTNIFFTGYVFLLIFIVFVALGVIIFKFVCEGLIKAGKLKSEQFQEFRNGWTLVLKGILFRIVLIAFPQMVVLCFWEITVRDSIAEVVLAVSTVVTMMVLLAWASLKVWRIARRSIAMHQSPAYILYSDPKALNKWGFLYVQFRAEMYYFIIILLGYILIKGMFVGLGQKGPIVQAIALVIIEAALLITIGIVRPYMDKKTNAFNIAIASVNLFNVLLLLFFAGVFNLPGLAIGIMGVLYFIVNVVFAFIILFMCLWASIRALMSKNPETRYQPMRDDRGSFIKSSTNLAQTTELDALGATARGDGANGRPGQQTSGDYYNAERKRMELEEEEDSLSSRLDVHQSGGYNHNNGGYNQNNGYGGYNKEERFMGSESPYGQQPNRTPLSANRGASDYPSRTASPAANPWQRGVGY